MFIQQTKLKTCPKIREQDKSYMCRIPFHASLIASYV